MTLMSACIASTEDSVGNEELEVGVLSEALTHDGAIKLNGNIDQTGAPYAPIRYGSGPADNGKGFYSADFFSGHASVGINNFADNGSNGRDVVAAISGNITCNSSTGRKNHIIPKFNSPVVHPKNLSTVDVTVPLDRFCASGETAYSDEINIEQTSYGR